MKLRYSPTSPYVRKVMVVAIETGSADQIELIPTNVWSADTDISDHNPLGKVPALLNADGLVLYDSPVVCEYLDSLHDGPKFFPEPGPERWQALVRQALGDGILDAAVLRFLEAKRVPGEKSDAWIGRQKVSKDRALDELEENADFMGGADKGPINIGHVAIGCALGYLDFRFPEDNWRAQRPALADWFDAFSARRSMLNTVPADPV